MNNVYKLNVSDGLRDQKWLSKSSTKIESEYYLFEPFCDKLLTAVLN